MSARRAIEWRRRIAARVASDHLPIVAEFEKRTGCAVLVNTSFNVRGEPIVCTPQDAYRCFMRTHLDYLVIGCFLLAKSAQPAFDETAWQNTIPLD